MKDNTEGGRNEGSPEELESSSEFSTSPEEEIEKFGEEEPELQKRGREKVVVPAIIIAIALIAGAFYFLDQRNYTSVPGAAKNDDGKSAVELCAEFVENELDCKVSWVPDNNLDCGLLISQSEVLGEKVKKESLVNLSYSAGPESPEMPILVDMTVEEAEEALYELGLSVEETITVDSAGKVAGTVVSSSVEPGTVLKNGDRVSLNVSNGAVIIPDWVGKTKEVVDTESSALGAKVSYVEQESEQAPGLVISQSVAAGESAAGEEVVVTLSKPIEIVEVVMPDVTGLTEEQAYSQVSSSGIRDIRTKIVRTPDISTKQVLSTVPSAGETVESDEWVVILVGAPMFDSENRELDINGAIVEGGVIKP